MAVGIALYLEDSNVMGIRPSHLDAIRLLCLAYEIDYMDIIDATEDRFFNYTGDANVSYTRFSNVDDWLAARTDVAIVGLETADRTASSGVPSLNMLTEFAHPDDNVVYLFGPAVGIPVNIIDADKTWVHLPQGQHTGLEARDVVTIVVVHRWLASLGG